MSNVFLRPQEIRYFEDILQDIKPGSTKPPRTKSRAGPQRPRSARGREENVEVQRPPSVPRTSRAPAVNFSKASNRSVSASRVHSAANASITRSGPFAEPTVDAKDGYKDKRRPFNELYHLAEGTDGPTFRWETSLRSHRPAKNTKVTINTPLSDVDATVVHRLASYSKGPEQIGRALAGPYSDYHHMAAVTNGPQWFWQTGLRNSKGPGKELGGPGSVPKSRGWGAYSEGYSKVKSKKENDGTMREKVDIAAKLKSDNTDLSLGAVLKGIGKQKAGKKSPRTAWTTDKENSDGESAAMESDMDGSTNLVDETSHVYHQLLKDSNMLTSRIRRLQKMIANPHNESGAAQTPAPETPFGKVEGASMKTDDFQTPGTGGRGVAAASYAGSPEALELANMLDSWFKGKIKSGSSAKAEIRNQLSRFDVEGTEESEEAKRKGTRFDAGEPGHSSIGVFQDTALNTEDLAPPPIPAPPHITTSEIEDGQMTRKTAQVERKSRADVTQAWLEESIANASQTLGDPSGIKQLAEEFANISRKLSELADEENPAASRTTPSASRQTSDRDSAHPSVTPSENTSAAGEVHNKGRVPVWQRSTATQPSVADRVNRKTASPGPSPLGASGRAKTPGSGYNLTFSSKAFSPPRNEANTATTVVHWASSLRSQDPSTTPDRYRSEGRRARYHPGDDSVRPPETPDPPRRSPKPESARSPASRYQSTIIEPERRAREQAEAERKERERQYREKYRQRLEDARNSHGVQST